MSNFLSIEEMKEAVEPVVESKPTFIMPKAPDRQAASNRAFLAEDLLRSWHSALNDEKCNTREMPEELLNKYQLACDILADIIDHEERLSRR